MEKNKELINNLKFAIIYGKTKVDNQNKDGIIEKIPKDIEDTAHYFYVKEFLKTHFLENPSVQSKNDVNSIFFEIQELNHIVFAENTSTSSHKTGIFYIPKELSEKQKISLTKLKKQLEAEDYNLTVLFDLYRTEDGILMGNQKMGKSSVLNDFSINKQSNSATSDKDDNFER